MNRLMKRLLIALAAVLALLPALGVAPASADPGVTTGAVNVRNGPGTRFAVIDSLAKGRAVEIERCQSGWCFVSYDRRDGWVSQRYLAQIEAPKRKQRRVERRPDYDPFYDDPFYRDPFCYGYGGYRSLRCDPFLFPPSRPVPPPKPPGPPPTPPDPPHKPPGKPGFPGWGNSPDRPDRPDWSQRPERPERPDWQDRPNWPGMNAPGGNGVPCPPNWPRCRD